MPLAYIQFIEKPDWERPDRPVDPGYGRPEGGPGVGGGPIYPPVHKPSPPDIDELPGQPLPPGQLPSLPTPPGDLSNKVVVLIWKPGTGWKGKVLDAAHPGQPLPRPPGGRPDNELPQPQPPEGSTKPNPTPDPHGYPSEQARWNR